MTITTFNYSSCPTLTGIGNQYGECGACGPSGKGISKTVNDKTIYTICFDPAMDLDINGNIIARYVQNPNVLDEPISMQTGSGKFWRQNPIFFRRCSPTHMFRSKQPRFG